MACTFSTSQLPKVLRDPGVLYLFTSKSASRHNGVQLFISHLPRCLRTCRFSEPTFRPSGATKHRIKGPDNPTSQLLPILSFKSSCGDGEGRKDKGGGERLCVKVCEKIVCIYVCMYVCMYVCVCVCVTKLRVKDGVCESDVSARQCRHLFFASAAMSSALHAASLRTWNGLNEVFHDLLCSMRCNEMCYVTAAPVLQPRIRR